MIRVLLIIYPFMAYSLCSDLSLMFSSHLKGVDAAKISTFPDLKDALDESESFFKRNGKWPFKLKKQNKLNLGGMENAGIWEFEFEGKRYLIKRVQSFPASSIENTYKISNLISFIGLSPSVWFYKKGFRKYFIQEYVPGINLKDVVYLPNAPRDFWEKAEKYLSIDIAEKSNKYLRIAAGKINRDYLDGNKMGELISKEFFGLKEGSSKFEYKSRNLIASIFMAKYILKNDQLIFQIKSMRSALDASNISSSDLQIILPNDGNRKMFLIDVDKFLSKSIQPDYFDYIGVSNKSFNEFFKSLEYLASLI